MGHKEAERQAPQHPYGRVATAAQARNPTVFRHASTAALKHLSGDQAAAFSFRSCSQVLYASLGLPS